MPCCCWTACRTCRRRRRTPPHAAAAAGAQRRGSCGRGGPAARQHCGRGAGQRRRPQQPLLPPSLALPPAAAPAPAPAAAARRCICCHCLRRSAPRSRYTWQRRAAGVGRTLPLAAAPLPDGSLAAGEPRAPWGPPRARTRVGAPEGGGALWGRRPPSRRPLRCPCLRLGARRQAQPPQHAVGPALVAEAAATLLRLHAGPIAGIFQAAAAPARGPC